MKATAEAIDRACDELDENMEKLEDAAHAITAILDDLQGTGSEDIRDPLAGMADELHQLAGWLAHRKTEIQMGVDPL